jgi:Fe-S-cluster-containing dehydrogenase component
MRYGMVIDLKRCIGCYGCQAVCKVHNATPPGVFWSRVLSYETGKYPAVRKNVLPVLCMHCGSPSCVDVCPTAATVKREDGIVVINPAKCLGCGNCVIACPYGARQLNVRSAEYFPGQGLTPYEEFWHGKHSEGAVGKCDFCLSNIEQGRGPACVEVCMSGARFFGDLDDPESEVSQLIRKRRGRKISPASCPGAMQPDEDGDMDASVFYLPAD